MYTLKIMYGKYATFVTHKLDVVGSDYVNKMICMWQQVAAHAESEVTRYKHELTKRGRHVTNRTSQRKAKQKD